MENDKRTENIHERIPRNSKRYKRTMVWTPFTHMRLENMEKADKEVNKETVLTTEEDIKEAIKQLTKTEN